MTRSWIEKDPASQEVATVCGDCNHGWMSNLETAARPLLVPMLNGRQLNLDQPQQRILATWAFKGAVVGEYVDPPNAIVPFDERSWLRTSGEPPTDVYVFITGADGRSNDDLNFDSYRLVPPPPRDGEAPIKHKVYVATLIIKHLALQVVWSKVENVTPAHQPPLARSVQRIWPFMRNFRWPPGPVLPISGLRAFTDAWRRR